MIGKTLYLSSMESLTFKNVREFAFEERYQFATGKEEFLVRIDRQKMLGITHSIERLESTVGSNERCCLGIT